MKPWILIGCTMLAACGAAVPNRNDAAPAGAREPAVLENASGPFNRAMEKAAAATRPADDPDAESLQYYPLSRYREFPPAVRSLLRLADAQNDHCRGGHGDDPETLRACNRRQETMVALERKGWCWGGGEIAAEDHWLKCADDPGYRPGQLEKERPFSEEDIQEVAALGKKQSDEESEPLDRCLDTEIASPANTGTNLHCYREEFVRVDRKLNATYKPIISRLSAAERSELVKSERAWVNYRGNKCFAGQNPAMDEMRIALFCRINETADRIAWLKKKYPRR